MCTYRSWLSTEVYSYQKVVSITNRILIFLFFTLPFNIGNKLGVKAVFFTKPPSLAIEKEFLLNKLHTNKSGDFTQVHPRNHLFKSEQSNKNHGNLKKTELNARMTIRQRADLLEVNIMAKKISLPQGESYTEREIMSDKMDWTGNTSLSLKLRLYSYFSR